MKRLISREITHREIPLQIGLTNQTYENMMIQDGEIENSKNTPEYVFESSMDSMEWRLKDQNST